MLVKVQVQAHYACIYLGEWLQVLKVLKERLGWWKESSQLLLYDTIEDSRRSLIKIINNKITTRLDVIPFLKKKKTIGTDKLNSHLLFNRSMELFSPGLMVGGEKMMMMKVLLYFCLWHMKKCIICALSYALNKPKSRVRNYITTMPVPSATVGERRENYGKRRPNKA